MRLLTKNTDYALRALVFLAKHRDDFVPSRLIADREDMPLQFLRGILRRLIAKGIVVAREGVEGGVKLFKKPNQIYLIQVIEIFQGAIQVSSCMLRKKLCPQRVRCVLRRRIKVIERKLIDEFRGITVQDLLKEAS